VSGIRAAPLGVVQPRSRDRISPPASRLSPLKGRDPDHAGQVPLATSPRASADGRQATAGRRLIDRKKPTKQVVAGLLGQAFLEV
jgi:hypothetical protein